MGIPTLTSILPPQNPLLLPSDASVTIDVPALLRLEALPTLPNAEHYTFNLEGVSPLCKLGEQISRLSSKTPVCPLFRDRRVLHTLTSQLSSPSRQSFDVNHCSTEAEHGPMMSDYVVSADSDFHVLLTGNF